MGAGLTTEYDIVHLTVVDSTCVTVVGEYHNSVQSQQLIQRVLSDVSPVAVCIELCPDRYNPKPQHGPLLYRERGTEYTRGTSTVEKYAQDNGIPVYLVDEWYRAIREYDHPSDLSPPRPDPEGDIDIEALRAFRGRVRDEHPTYFEELLQRRERVIAGHIRAAARDIRGPIVAVVGAAHAEPVASLLPSIEPIPLSNNRCVSPR